MNLDKLAAAPSRPQCVCSTMGFEHPVWNAVYYPENCPEEWRLAYFMNDFRAVYLPVIAWLESEQQIAAITEELDENFELVIEFPPLGAGQDIETALLKLEPIGKNISCVVVDVDGVSEPVLKAAYRAISERYAINFCSNKLDANAREALLRQYQVGFVWHPEQSESEALISAAPYQVVCLPCQSLRDVKSVLARLRPILEQPTRVGLFFEPAERSVHRAMEVRTLTELMGLA